MAIKGSVDDLDVFEYGGRPVIPEQGSYSVTLQNGVRASEISGGLDKQQVQFINAPYEVSVTYEALDASKTFFIEQFLNRNRGQRFVATLLIGNTELEQFVVQQIETPNISKTGFSGSMQVTYQVEPAVDQCFIDWTLENMACVSGEDWCEIFCNTQEGVEIWPS